MSFLKRSKKIFRLLAIMVLLMVVATPTWAAGPPEPSIFDNSLALTLIILMIILLIIIAVLASILVGAADVKLKKTRKATETVAASLILLFLLSGSSSFAQNGAPAAQTAAASASSIAGMASTTFYIMASVIFLELTTILVLLLNIKALLKAEKEKIVKAEAKVETVEEKRMKLSWWDKFNKLRPVAQEAELDLGHTYDGIRELNNRLPPWWIYGFYLTIVFAGIYLWRYHISHSAPSSKQEFEIAVAKGDAQVEQYLKIKGDNVDENTVTMLTDAADIEAGKTIFTNPVNCVPCHRADAGGVVGPNLTDDYWLYGGSLKDVFKTIKYGTNKGMKSWKDDLSAKQIAQVASYVKSLHGTNPPNPKEQQGELYRDGLTTKPAGDSLKTTNDSLRIKDGKVAKN